MKWHCHLQNRMDKIFGLLEWNETTNKLLITKACRKTSCAFQNGPYTMVEFVPVQYNLNYFSRPEQKRNLSIISPLQTRENECDLLVQRIRWWLIRYMMPFCWVARGSIPAIMVFAMVCLHWLRPWGRVGWGTRLHYGVFIGWGNWRLCLLRIGGGRHPSWINDERDTLGSHWIRLYAAGLHWRPIR